VTTQSLQDIVDAASTSPAPQSTEELASGWEKGALFLYLAGSAIALMYFLVRLWPETEPSGAWNTDVVVFWRAAPIRDVPDDMRLLLLVIVAGGLGSFIHAATSFVDYVGNRRFFRSWIMWYVLRPFIGSALAVVLYSAVRGGLLTATAGGDSVSPFGVAALAFLAGMFSKQATDKLNELFTTLFKTSGDGDAVRKDKLDTAPRVTSIEPQQLRAGGAVELLVNGSGFESTSIVRLDGQAKPTTFVNPSTVVVKIAPGDFATAATLKLTVHNASGQSSSPMELKVV